MMQRDFNHLFSKAVNEKLDNNIIQLIEKSNYSIYMDGIYDKDLPPLDYLIGFCNDLYFTEGEIYTNPYDEKTSLKISHIDKDKYRIFLEDIKCL